MKLIPILLLVIPLSLNAKNIAIYIDGTGNHPEMGDQEEGTANTNIRRMFCSTVEDENQKPVYHSGVGAKGWPIWDAKGALTEFGGEFKKEDAYNDILENYEDGDTLFLFGFSRGAAIVRDLANCIVEKGVNSNLKNSIEMVGLFDTVGAFGVPLDLFGFPFQELNIGKKLDLPNQVKHAYHAVSIDENREAFIPTLLYTQDSDRVEEVWFPGVHTDIGGGYVHRGIAKITLA